MTSWLVNFTDHMTRSGHMTPGRGIQNTLYRDKIIFSHPSHILPSDLIITDIWIYNYVLWIIPSLTFHALDVLCYCE